jgi:glycine/D-amino acid oxidase-like deaminating enzyme
LNRSVTREDFARLRTLIGHHIPALSGCEPVAAKVCMYENTPDEHFLCGTLPGADRTVVVGGGSGHAFKFASALGEAAAAIVVGRSGALDVGLFDPGRFG